MEYEGLTRNDLANVEALNRAWLRCCGDSDIAAGKLTATLRDRMATAPFLLFSFREQDDDLWSRLLEKCPQQDLLDERRQSSDQLRLVQLNGLSFIWGLAQRNPYAARFVSVAPSRWCEKIMSVTLVRFVESTSSRNLLEPRLETASMLHRRFAQMGALQSLLFTSQPAYDDRMRAAACRTPQIVRQIANKV
ncbi:MAG TPA: hypothetical protein VJ993_05830 [Woeseiaceae bacterium]|nr:hypothetical protein [Woeseiaceae bacterium]